MNHTYTHIHTYNQTCCENEIHEQANNLRTEIVGNDFVEQFFFYIGSVTKASECDTEKVIIIVTVNDVRLASETETGTEN